TMREMGFSKVGIISVRTNFGVAWIKELTELAPENGIDVVNIGAYDSSQEDFNELMDELKDKNLDAVINVAVGPIQSLMTKAYKAAGFQMPLFQSHGFTDIYYVYAAGEASEGVLCPSLIMAAAEGLPDTNDQRKIILEFKAAYQNRYKEEANFFKAHAHDALMILLQAIQKAGLDRERVRDIIETTEGFVGVGGIYGFSAVDHNGLAKDIFHSVVVHNGEFVLLSSLKESDEKPEERAFEYLPVLAVLDFKIENLSDSDGTLIVDYLSNAIFQCGKFYVLARNQRETS
ncbi:unnamed protein product, partial [marine sediment metagenome]